MSIQWPFVIILSPAILITNAVQIFGHGARAVSHAHTTSIALHALQTLFILLAPTFYLASIYTVLERVISFLKGEKSELCADSTHDQGLYLRGYALLPSSRRRYVGRHL